MNFINKTLLKLKNLYIKNRVLFFIVIIICLIVLGINIVVFVIGSFGVLTILLIRQTKRIDTLVKTSDTRREQLITQLNASRELQQSTILLLRDKNYITNADTDNLNKITDETERSEQILKLVKDIPEKVLEEVIKKQDIVEVRDYKYIKNKDNTWTAQIKDVNEFNKYKKELEEELDKLGFKIKSHYAGWWIWGSATSTIEEK